MKMKVIEKANLKQHSIQYLFTYSIHRFNQFHLNNTAKMTSQIELLNGNLQQKCQMRALLSHPEIK